MLNIWFIRHAQSQANAGERTADPALIELTALGREQGSYVAGLFGRAPDILVTSPYLRARQTAQFVADKHPQVPLETWPVQEFTYLGPAAVPEYHPSRADPDGQGVLGP